MRKRDGCDARGGVQVGGGALRHWMFRVAGANLSGRADALSGARERDPMRARMRKSNPFRRLPFKVPRVVYIFFSNIVVLDFYPSKIGTSYARTPMQYALVEIWFFDYNIST